MTDAATPKRRFRPLLWPITVPWRAVTFVANRIGILPTLAIGVGLTLLGYLLTSTIIGAILGIPMLIAGLFFLARGLY